MLHSMTGFGHARATSEGWTLTIEVRTVNHRTLDVRSRVPPEHARLARALSERVSERMARGRVEVTVALAEDDGPAGVHFDDERALAIVTAARAFAACNGIEDTLSLDAVIGAPGVITGAKVAVPEPALVDELLERTVDEAVSGLLEARAREGTQLHKVLTSRLAHLEVLTDRIENRAQGASARLRAALDERIKETGVVVDEQRLIQEIALLADKADVSEEFDRLRAHIAHARSLLDDVGPVGRKLDFLCQELNREANTIGSKTQDAETAHVVVDLKSEIERVREQVQNIE